MIDNHDKHETSLDTHDPATIYSALIAAWHEYRLRDKRSAFYSDSKFAEWLANEFHEDITEMRSGEVIESTATLATDIQARVAAAKSKLKCVRAAPEFQAPIVPGSPHQVAAAASHAGAAPFLELGVAAGIGRELWDEECFSWVRLPDGIPKGSYVALNVSGESMMPLLHSGDVMLLKLESSFSSGDIVVARSENDGFVVKRVNRVMSDYIELGSINPQYGSIRVKRISESIVGVVVLSWCSH